MNDSAPDASGPKVLEEDLLAVLRRATATPALSYDGEPTRLTGGFWAELVAFRLSGAPEGWRGRLVARVMPDGALAAKETIIQGEMAAQGFATPSIHVAGGPDDGLGRAFMVMDHAGGAPLLAGLSGVGAITQLPALARRIPETLASCMARLHLLDVEPVRCRLVAPGSSPGSAAVAAVDREPVGDRADAGSGASTDGEHGGATYTTVGSAGDGMPSFVAALETAAAALGRADLVAGARWLADHPPAPAPDVVCHGDLHPFNVLMDDGGTVTVLDWSAAIVAPAAYDVAFTSLVLAEPPLLVPRAARPLVRAAGRLLARRFVRGYERHSGAKLDMASLRWHQGVVCLRALVEVAHWVVGGDIEHRSGHPWLVSGSQFAARLSSLTGATVSPR